MKFTAFLVVFAAATPAFANHEVVAAASIFPLLGGIATFTLAGLAAWREQRKSRQKTVPKLP